MLKLYGGARSRAAIPQWYLEELGVPYEFVRLDMAAGEHRQPDFLKINPMGKVPAIAVSGTADACPDGLGESEFHLWESGAILLYLAEKYGPPLTLEQRSELNQWILFANATLGPGIFVEASRDKEMKNLFPPLNERLSQRPYILGDEFTAADVAVGSMLAYMPLMLKLDFADHPGIQSYLKRITERPAFQKTIGAR